MKFISLNKKNLLLGLGSFIVSFTFFSSVLFPIWNDKTGSEIVIDSLDEIKTVGDDENWWISHPLEPYQISPQVDFNWTRFWQVYKNHALWSLEAKHPVTGEWIEQTELLIIHRDYISDNSVKVGLEFTTPDNGYTLDWRLTMGIDYKLKQYLNTSGNYNYTLSFEAGGRRFNVIFDWSDMLQYPNLIFRHGKRNIDGDDYFFFRVRKNGIQPDNNIYLDPQTTVNDGTNLDHSIYGDTILRTQNGSFICLFGEAFDLYKAWSEDMGVTWDVSKILGDADTYVSAYPAIAIGSDDVIHVVFQGTWNGHSAYDIRYLNSTDWGNAKNITTDSKTVARTAICIDANDSLYVFGEKGALGTSNDDQIIESHSYDNGDTWSNYATITNEIHGGDDTWLFKADVNETGAIHLFSSAEDLSASTKDAIVHIYSTDSGVTWSGWNSDILPFIASLDMHLPTFYFDANDTIQVYCTDKGYDKLYHMSSTPSGWTDATATFSILNTFYYSDVAPQLNNWSAHVVAGDARTSDYALRYNYNNSGSWGSWTTIASNGGDDMIRGNFLYANYPMNGTVKQCIPNQGYALVYRNVSDDSLHFYSSSNLEFKDDVSAGENTAPTLTNEAPTNSSTNIEISSSLYVVCTDADGDTMNATWSSNSSGAWIDFGTNSSISTGTNITQPNTNFSTYSTSYWWRVNLSDGNGSTIHEIYHFTTDSSSWNNIQVWNGTVTNASISWQNIEAWNGTVNNLSKEWLNIQTWDGTLTNSSVYLINITNIFPLNNSVNNPLQSYLYLTINHTNGETMNITWYYGLFEGDETILLGTDTNITNSTQNELFFIASGRATNYYWRVHVNDGAEHINETFNFKTEGYGMGGGQLISDGNGMGAALLIGGISFVLLLFIIIRKRRDD